VEEGEAEGTKLCFDLKCPGGRIQNGPETLYTYAIRDARETFPGKLFCNRIASRLQNGPETLDTYAIRDPRNLFQINPINDGISEFGVATKMPPECRGGIPGVQKIQFGQGIAAPNGFLEARAGGGKAHVQLSAGFHKDNEDPQGHAK